MNPRQWTRYPAYRDSGVEWLGEVPSHWEGRRLKHVTEVLVSNVDKHAKEGEAEVRLCNYTDVYYNDRITPHLDFMVATASSSQIDKFTLRADDVIITKDSETAEDIAVPAVVTDDMPGVVCGYHLALLRPHKAKISGAFLNYMLRADPVSDQFTIGAQGITRHGLTYQKINDVNLYLPPLPEQRAIATFLDRETARIDALIAKKKELIRLLEEKRTALISHAVTKGLDPSVPMKDSGVPWLGEIPAHWRALKIRRLCQVKRGASPRPIDDPAYFDEDGEYAWVRIADVTASKKYLETTTQRLSALGSSKSVKLEPGELFLSIAATVGKPCINAIRCCIHDGFVYFVGLKQDREFLYWMFQTSDLYTGVGKTGTQLNLNTDTVGDLWVPVPPLNEQCAIATECQRISDTGDRELAVLQDSAALLREQRQALITAAVTGQIDVRDELAEVAAPSANTCPREDAPA